MVISQHPPISATKEEIERLKALVPKLPKLSGAAPRPIITSGVSTNNEFGGKVAVQSMQVGSLFKGGIGKVEITREPIRVDNPVQWLKILRPDFNPYRWQIETLMQIAGYLEIGKYAPENRIDITDRNPFLFVGSMANGSGKDMVLIAAAATWLVVSGLRNRVIITSSSHKQIKDQTEPHIRELINLANRKFGTIFKSIQFHHLVPELGGEIVLYVTDEAGKAEGYHPYSIGKHEGNGGKMMIIKNEAKSIPEFINAAMLRCTGYSHILEISSPGPRSGFMYKHASEAILYPAKVELGKYYFRRVSAYDCPHLVETGHIERFIYEFGADSPQTASSINAEFSDIDSVVVISDYEYESALKKNVPERGEDIGIGLDVAAGGDENAGFVRRGNKIIYSFFFRQHDTDVASLLVDKHLLPWKNVNYTFRCDNGGLGLAFIDKLKALGWNVIRTNNQSPARNKKEFGNLGAEMWFHVKRLLSRGDIILPKVDKLRDQLTNRWYLGFDSTQGKYQLETKQSAKNSGRSSPDRADAFVLCFYSYRPSLRMQENPPEVKRNPTAAEWEIFLRNYSMPKSLSSGHPTLLTGAI